MEALDPAPHLGDGELAVVDLPAVVERAPDQRLAEARLAARHVCVGPAPALDQLEIDVARVPVEVDVGARRERGDQADAALARGKVELVDEAVLALAQIEFAQHRAEVVGEGETRMRRVEDEGHPRRERAVAHESRGEEDGAHGSEDSAGRRGAAHRDAR
jgi:hypothetical protein